MAHSKLVSGGKLYSAHVMPVLVDCNFVVDSTNGNGLGIRSLKGAMVQNVFMNTQNSSYPNQPNLASARSYSVIAASTITSALGSPGTILSGSLGLYPGTSVTGFPPATVAGIVNVANTAAMNAQAASLAAFNSANSLAGSATAIPAVLDGQTLTPGVYKEASSTFSLAGTISGTLTLNGAGVYIFIASSTLITGSGGTPTITLTGGARASDIYWIVNSSATINSGHSGTFHGNVIADQSITVTSAGTVNGTLAALHAAVTLTAAVVVNPQSLSPSFVAPGSPNPAPGTIVVQLSENFNRVFSGFDARVSPVSGSALKIDNSALTPGVAYIIVSVGDASRATWTALGLPPGVEPAVGASFIALSDGGALNASSSRVMATAAVGTGIASIETVGNASLSLGPKPVAGQLFGGQLIMQCRDYTGALAAPTDGSVISLVFYLSNSSVMVAGE